MSSLVVECDSDGRGFVVDVGLRNAKADRAHLVADAVAWANNHGIELDGAVAVDRVDQITKELKR